jgi:DNA-binding transcriptional LysR family regulator|nr:MULTISPECIES: LysR substrate-binding domain-containing protein [unclassified Bradyrhizobium]
MVSDFSDIRSSRWAGQWSVLREMELICAIVAERKTTGAAQRLGISQPAVSRGIAKIEQRWGRPLFTREGGRLAPTAEALSIYERSTEIFKSLRELDALSSAPGRRELTVIAPPSIGHLLLQREVATFAKANPEILISFETMTLDNLASAVAEQPGAVGITDANVSHAGVRFEPFLETKAVCVMPEGHPLASASVVTAADLDQVDYVSITRRISIQGALEQIFFSAGVRPRTVIEADAALSALGFISEGMGVSVLNPLPVLLELPKGVVARPFEPTLTLQTRFVIPAASGLTSDAAIFVEYLRSQKSRISELMAKHQR